MLGQKRLDTLPEYHVYTVRLHNIMLNLSPHVSALLWSPALLSELKHRRQMSRKRGQLLYHVSFDSLPIVTRRKANAKGRKQLCYSQTDLGHDEILADTTHMPLIGDRTWHASRRVWCRGKARRGEARREMCLRGLKVRSPEA